MDACTYGLEDRYNNKWCCFSHSVQLANAGTNQQLAIYQASNQAINPGNIDIFLQ